MACLEANTRTPALCSPNEMPVSEEARGAVKVKKIRKRPLGVNLHHLMGGGGAD